MAKKISKTLAIKEIENFFLEIKDNSPKEVEKIKKLAMSHNLKLKEKRKLFCKKCLTPYKNPGIRIKNKIKSITCDNCGSISRWKMTNSS